MSPDSPLRESDKDLVRDVEEDFRARAEDGAELSWEADNGLHVDYEDDDDDDDYDVDAPRPGRNLLFRVMAEKPRGVVRNASDAELRVGALPRGRAPLRAQPRPDGAPGRGVPQPLTVPQPQTIQTDNRPQQKVKPRDADGRLQEAGLRRQQANADLVRNQENAFPKTGKRAELRPARTQQPPAGRGKAADGQKPPPVAPGVNKRKRRRPVKRGGGEKLQVPTDGVPQQGGEDVSVPQQAVAPTLPPDLTASRSKRSKGPFLPAPHPNPYNKPHQDVPALSTKPYRDPRAKIYDPALDLHKRVEANHADIRHRKVESPVGVRPAGDTTSSTVIKSAEALGDEGETEAVLRGGEKQSEWAQVGNEEEANYEEVEPTQMVFDLEVVWSQTFQVDQLDLQLLRSDWIDLNCNVSGNMLLHPRDAQVVVGDYMAKLDFKHPGYVRVCLW